MTAALQRLEYMRGFMSRGNIQSETGIHWARQEAYIRGTATLSTDETRLLSNAYSRLGYSQLTESGMSAKQASRFRSYAPSGLREKIDTMESLVTKLAEGSLKAKMAREHLTFTYDEYLGFLEDFKDNMRWGLRESKKTYEEWLDYVEW